MRAQETRGLVRQGDILLVPIAELSIPDGSSLERGDEFLIAEGEVTGHAHVVRGSSLLVTSPGSAAEPAGLQILVEESATLTHDEHDPLPLERGAYRVVQQREYMPWSLEDPASELRWVLAGD